ncbi:MAG: outer membrane beta-barrel protein [Gammaproteobacteria bacterium]|nr:outer membrane beta-barrel protein [Gammaproteobacteria bacterium]
MRAGTMAKVTAIALGALGVASVASAESWVYVGGSGGYSVIDTSSGNINQGAVNSGFASAQTSVDDTDYGWKAFGGWRINKYFALEATYVDFGEAKFTTNTTGPDGVIRGEADAEAFALDVLAIVRPADWLDLFVKVGGFYWDVDAKLAAVVDGRAGSAKSNDTGTNFKAGAGLSFVLSEDISLRLEAEGYFDVGDEDTTGEADIGFFSIGLNYGF